MDMTNSGLYAALMEEYGNKSDAGAFILMNLESGPLMTLLILGSTGVADINLYTLLGLTLPFILGYALGNLDCNMRTFLSQAIQPIIPFFAFALGNSIDLTVIYQTGLLGIAMSFAVIIITGTPLILADIFIGKGTGTAGIAASSTAGAAVATPTLIAEVAPQFKASAPAATALVATSLITTSVIVPVITALYAQLVRHIQPWQKSQQSV